MNQSTRGWGQSRGTHGSRKGRAKSVRQSRLPGVLLASLVLALLGATVMWSAASTAEVASGRWRSPLEEPAGGPSLALVSTVTSAAPVPRGSSGPGRRPGRERTLQTLPVTILRSEPLSGSSQVQARPQAGPRSKAASKPTAKPRGRLPRYFGKVGVSATQKQRIYSIQAMYRERAEALTRQLEELRDQERQGILAVLTSLQKQRLAELIRMAEVAREARQRARQKGQSSQTPPGAPGRTKPTAGGPRQR